MAIDTTTDNAGASTAAAVSRQAGPRRFRPSLLPTLATLATLALLLWLGFWQLDRGEQKQRLLAQFETRLAEPPVALATLGLSADSPASRLEQARYRRVTARGVYDGAHTLLLDNQIYRGRPGYHVYTALRPTGVGAEAEPAILVNRGWLPARASRRRLPALPPPVDGPTTVSGRLAQPANPGIRLGDPDAITGWPRALQHIDYAAAARALGYPLLPAVLLLTPDDGDTDGLIRDWQPDFGTMTPSKHRGYAVQWFGLALTLVVIYLAMNLRKR